MSLHKERTHPGPDVPGCFGCRVSSVHVSAAITVPHKTAARQQHSYMHNFAAEFENGDREAYKRLRQQGLQPPRIAGSANLEKHAETRFEVESGQVLKDQKGLKEALTRCADGGLDPTKSHTTPKDAA